MDWRGGRGDVSQLFCVLVGKSKLIVESVPKNLSLKYYKISFHKFIARRNPA
jgi:hypothetical protein